MDSYKRDNEKSYQIKTYQINGDLDLRWFHFANW